MVINGLRGRHTDTQTHTRTHTDAQTKAISRNQVHAAFHAPGLKRWSQKGIANAFELIIGLSYCLMITELHH